MIINKVTIDNLIVIRGGAYNDIKRALRQWIELYSKDLQDGLNFKLFKNGRGNHFIQADKRLDNERFYYLVNYLNYPEGIDYKIEIEGFTTGKEQNKLKDKNLLVYISPNDKEYDNVFVVTSDNENFKVEFDGRITEIGVKKSFRQPINLTFDFSEIFVIDKKLNNEKEIKGTSDNLSKRFKLITAITLTAFILISLVFKSHEDFLKINSIISFAVWGWLMFDYKILQIDRLYLGSVALSLTIFFYGYYLNKEFLQEDESIFVSIGTTVPIFFLIIQRPVKFAFKRIMKREPVVNKPAPSFADFIYIFILWMASLLIPAFYYTK